jgi:hypothetical protein
MTAAQKLEVNLTPRSGINVAGTPKRDTQLAMNAAVAGLLKPHCL